MADGPLPPPPINDQPGSYVWLDWYRQLRNYVTTSGSVPWYIINFAGSNITDIATRLHNTLQGLQGGSSGEMYHLTQADHTNAVNALPTTGGTMTGPIDFLELVPPTSGTIDIVPDLGNPGSDMLEVLSNDGVQVKGPFINLDASNITVTIPGGQVGSPLIIAGFDALGRAVLGWGQPAAFVYSVSTTSDIPVTIKPAGDPVPSPWVDLGLTITLTENAPANSAIVTYDVHLQNPTTRSGIIEFGLRVNGVDLYRDVTQQIPANFDSKVPSSVPLINPYVIGDVITLIARVTSQSNINFELNMLASPTDLALFRFEVLRQA